MTIKNKLVTLVFGEMLMFLFVIGLIVLLFMPVISINSESNQLSKLAEHILLMEVRINSLMHEPFGLEYAKALEQKDKLNEQFRQVEKEKNLSAINDKVAQSIKAIMLLEGLFEERWISVVELTPRLLQDSEEIMFTTATPLINFYKMSESPRFKNKIDVLARVEEYEQQIDVTDGALSSAYDVISTQYDIIQAEIAKRIRQLIVRALIIFGIVLIGVIFVALRLASSLAGNIKSLLNGVELLRNGNLATVFNTASKDEIGTLGKNLNLFTEELSSSILKIKESSANNLVMKAELSVAAENSEHSSDGIAEVADSIREGMVDLDGRVAESGEAVNIVKSRTAELGGMLEEQMAMIEESTSSVTEMIASIGNVNEITGKKKAATDELVKAANEGGERLTQTIRIIQEITGNIDEIRGTASVIQAVAAQTSLLAMNAAIEAAHAGEYGAGFSVVAEEIRKLADASSDSSKQISGVIKDVIGSIEKAASSGEETKHAFADINREVIDVAGALDEISSSMVELAAGGRQILDAMSRLQGYASGVNDSSGTMDAAADRLESAFRTVERVTSSVLSEIAGIGNRIDEISSAVAVVAGISSRLSTESERLEAEAVRFTVGESGQVD